MLTDERKTHLFSTLQQTGRIVAKTESLNLYVSEDTIRRDLRELAKEGQLKRVHGGAVPIASANAPFSGRVSIASPEKVAIGKRTAQLIEPGQVVFIDGGTTALQLARNLPPNLEATVITHSPNIAMELMDHDRLEIEIVGGRLFRHSIVTCGATTLDRLNRCRPDICFIGAAGLHPDQGITTGDSEEAEVKRTVIDRSASTTILASSEKLGAVSSFELANWSDIDNLVVSAETHSKAVEMFSDLGCEIISASQN